ncbi:MAG: hypothetical protein RLZZ450_534 [Pseudomonadota bacterium]|jgi:quercetin dioxygenase-like cupin family protein
MPDVYLSAARTWRELAPGVFASDFYRYAGGGGAALFRMSESAVMAEHGHPTGEHVYVVGGRGTFGELALQAGDALWVAPGERHSVHAITEFTFFATSLP